MTSAGMTPEEVDDVAAENAEPGDRIELEDDAKKSSHSSLFRRIIAIILAILAILAIVASVDAIWLKTTLQDEDQFVATFQNLTTHEDIATSLSVRIADGIVEATDAEAYFTENLPPELQFIAAPITDATTELLANAAKPLIQSDAVNTAWTAALRATHVAVSAVLSGNDGALVNEGGQVAIDLDEIAGVVVERAAEAGLTLPEAETSFGQIVIYESEELAAAQNVAQGISQMGWVLPFVALVLIIGAAWVSPDRRWMALFLGFGTAFGMLLSLASLRIGQNMTLNTIEDEIVRNAGEAAWDITFDRLVSGSWGVLMLGLVIGFIAWAVGPSPRAQQFTMWVSDAVDSWRKPEEADPNEFSKFLAGSKRTIELIVVAIALLFMLFGPSLSAVRVLVITLVVVGILILVEILAGPAEGSQETALREDEQIDA